MVDNASDAFAGDENNRRQVRAFMRMLVEVARANDAGLVLLAHVDKSAAKFGANRNSYSGSTAWHNSARSRLALTERDGRIELIHEKHNLGPAAEPVPLFWSASGVLMPAGLTVGREMQLKRFHERRHDPFKQWKVTDIDRAAIDKYDDYTRAEADMLRFTHSAVSPWTVINANDQRRARLESMRVILSALDYAGKDEDAVGSVDPRLTMSGADYLAQINGSA